jgi:antitoxin component YwqK of YwqJK toxin-antitoxin module
LGRPRITWLVALSLATSSACLVRSARPGPAPPTATHETRRRTRSDGSLESEVQLRLSSDGALVRDGFEREYHPGARLAAERFFARDVPTGVWRAWYLDGTLRSETDFGPPGSKELRPSRFWHPDKSLAAEGAQRGGLREGEWRYYSSAGQLLRRGAYAEGQREGLWAFFDPAGRPLAEGRYSRGTRVGSWTLWDEHGVPHERPGVDVEVPAEADLFHPRR